MSLCQGLDAPALPGQDEIPTLIENETSCFTIREILLDSDTPMFAWARQTANLPPAQADHIVRSSQADMVLLGREILCNPYWPMTAAHEFGQITVWPAQYLRAAPRGVVALSRRDLAAFGFGLDCKRPLYRS